MRTLSVQTMPNGFEVETPTFGYWLKAGVAFGLGTLIAAVVWFVMILTVLTTLGLTGTLLRAAIDSAPASRATSRPIR